MFRFRHRWIRVLALFAVLVHAYALSTHHGMMISMAAANDGPGLGLGVMCRADGSKDIVDFDDLQNGGSGKPANTMSCPICSGAVPDAVNDVPKLVALAAPPFVAIALVDDANASLPVARAPKPPSTGPPALV